MLTEKQRRLLSFLDLSLKESGISPSFDEMREAMGLRSKSGIHRLVTALVDRGFVRRLPHRARAIEVVRSVDAAGDGFSSSTPDARRASSVRLSLMGRIAAGTPVESLRKEIDRVAVPTDMLHAGRIDDHYALEVRGDSMIRAGIFNGDLAVIRASRDAGDGEVIVALIDGREATLKRFRRKGDMVVLESANPLCETRLFLADRVSVRGRLCGILRRY